MIENRLTFVFLPGLDGSGNFFAPLVGELERELLGIQTKINSIITEIHFKIVNYPHDLLGYDAYADYARGQLPDTPCIIVAESFSGAIAAMISDNSQVRGVVFIASFLQSPVTGWRRVALRMNAPILMRIPAPKWGLRWALFGNDYNVEHAQAILKRVPAKTMIARLRLVIGLEAVTCIAPYVAIHGKEDNLVRDPIDGAVMIPGYHALSASNPRGCADAIVAFAKDVTKLA